MSNLNKTYKIARTLNNTQTHKIKFIEISDIPTRRMRHTRNRSTNFYSTTNVSLGTSSTFGTYQRRSRRYF